MKTSELFVQELFIQVAANVTVLSAVGAVLFYVVKKYFDNLASQSFEKIKETNKAIIEIEKDKEKQLYEIKKGVYPELVELVYRLRIQINEFSYAIGEKINNHEHNLPGIGFGEELYMLKELLYRNRVFLDEDIFSNSHRFKHLIQDADVIVDRLYRRDWPQDISPQELRIKIAQKCSESNEKILEIKTECDELYLKIVEQAKVHINSILKNT